MADRLVLIKHSLFRHVLYLSIARASIHANRYSIIGIFTYQGPAKCSGLPVRQYSEQGLTHLIAYFLSPPTKTVGTPLRHGIPKLLHPSITT